MVDSIVTSARRTLRLSAIKSILFAGFVAGALDIAMAIIVRSIELGGFAAAGILRYIASGAFGKEAFSASENMIWMGLLFHFLFSIFFALVFFLLFPHIRFLRKNKVLAGVLYGLVIWGLMNLLIVPISNTPVVIFKWGPQLLIPVAILMVCVGIPISFIVHRYYEKRYRL